MSDDVGTEAAEILKRLVNIKISKDAVRDGVRALDPAAMATYLRLKNEGRHAWREAFRVCGRTEEPR